MSNLFDVSGKHVLVTGGSRGIGLMIARGFAEAGARVWISSRKAEVCDRVAAELRDAGHDVVSLPADLATAEGVAALAAGVAEQAGGRLDVLVNNAGATWGAPLEDYPREAWDKLWDTNVKAVFGLTTALLEPLRAAATPDDPARVVNVGSIDALTVPGIENYAYSASKAALHMLTRHLGKRLAGEAICVNAIAPGPFDSKMMAFVLDDPTAREQVAASIPLGRIGRPDDVAGAAIFLASRAGSYLTGAVIPVDGGRSTVA